MIILTNGLTEVADEGFLKVANNLVKQIKSKKDGVFVISYERTSPLADEYLSLNKLLISKKLMKLLRGKKDSLLYIPFPAKTLPTAMRVFILSFLYGKKPDVVLVMKNKYGFLARLLLKLSRANIIVLSNDAYEFYGQFLSRKRIRYLKTGVDTEKFSSVDATAKSELRKKYGFESDVPLILHVGHLNYGRNVNELLKIDKAYRVLLVTSTLTKDEQDKQLRERLLAKENITVFDHYIQDIQDIYRMADVYFFPTLQDCHCIDVPLSCLEAASCNLPIVTTDYGEMKAFKGKAGYYFIESFDEDAINSYIEKALLSDEKSTRASVLEYDWNNSIALL
jgi:glycosyltransferase involved in cell wall biosynthesis